MCCIENSVAGRDYNAKFIVESTPRLSLLPIVLMMEPYWTFMRNLTVQSFSCADGCRDDPSCLFTAPQRAAMADSATRRYGPSLYRRRPSKSCRRNPTTGERMIAARRLVLFGGVGSVPAAAPRQVNALVVVDRFVESVADSAFE